MIDFIDAKTLFTIFHIFGVAIGAGGAYMSDAMFFKTVRDQKISHTEMEFLNLGSIMVWGGILLLVGSGYALFSLNPEVYLASSKFLVKITIVGIIIVNGIIFHSWHIPRMKRHVGHHLPSSDEFSRHRLWLLFGGAVSATSWSFAIILGVLRSIPYTYAQGILFYLLVVSIAMLVVSLIKNYILPTHSA